MGNLKQIDQFENEHIHYRPQTKLREGNVFRDVCLFTGGVIKGGAMKGVP